MLTSKSFASNQRLQRASENSPPMHEPESGPAVAILQQALIDLGFPLTITTRKTGNPDGVYGTETRYAIRAFQAKNGIPVDGSAGRQTLTKLDNLLNANPQLPTQSINSYLVPGLKTVIAQPSPMSCWATVYCMMRSWKDQSSYPIRDAVLKVGTRWADYYDKSYPPTLAGLPSNLFGAFLSDAQMTHQPMMNLMIVDWARLLRRHGLLWIGASVAIQVNSGLHSRILEGILGDGQPNSTFMKIIDPDGGKQYNESFGTFIAKYEAGILSVTGNYFQIRHFR